MANFPSIEPSFPVRKISKPKTRTVRFGDGYEHRLLFGLNQNPKVFNLTWKNISETDSDTIETFLDARGATESFDYTPENDTARKFVCESWSKTIPYLNRATIQATFREVFEP